MKYALAICFFFIYSFGSWAQEITPREYLLTASKKYNVNFSFKEEDLIDKNTPLFYPETLIEFINYFKERLDLEIILVGQNNYIVRTRLLDPIYNDESNLVNLDEVVISYIPKVIERSDYGAFVIKPSAISSIPGSINTDVFSTLEKLPGINNFNEAIGEFQIHGGSPDQNKILWNDIPVYRTSLLFGGLSSISPESVDKIFIYKSGVPAKWGDHIGGVVEMITILDNHLSYNFGINLLDVSAGISAPLNKDISVQFNSKKSLPNIEGVNNHTLFIKNFTQANQNIGAPLNNSINYGSHSGNIKVQLNKNNKVQVNAYIIDDQFSYSILENSILNKEVLFSHNYGFGATWETKWEKNTSKVSISKSNNFLDLTQNITTFKEEDDEIEEEIENVLAKKNKVREFIGRWDYSIEINKRTVIETGYWFNKKNIFLDYDSESIIDIETINFENTNLITHALYTTLQHALDPKTLLNIGLRGVSYNTEGSLILEPRIKIQREITPSNLLGFSYEHKSQNVFQTNQSLSDVMERRNPVWVGSDGGLFPVMKSKEYSLNYTYVKDRFLIDIEFFNKRWSGITTMNYGYLDPHDSDYHYGESKAAGVDFYGNIKLNSFLFWGSYSYLETQNKFENVNNFNWFTGNYNLNNSISLGLIFQAKDLNMGINWTHHSGLPSSTPTGVSFFDGHYHLNYDALNDSKLPDYNRLDLNFSYELKKGKFFNTEVRTSLINATNENNILFKDYKYLAQQDKIIEIPQYSLGSIFNIGLFFSSKN